MDTGVLIALVVLAMPLLAGTLIGVMSALGKSLPGRGDIIATGAMGVSLAGALALAFGGFAGQRYDIEWLTVGETTWRIGINLDGLTLAMLLVVTIVSFLVHLFSMGYMHDDSRYTDFFRWLGLFTFSMLGLVLSDNLITLFISWEIMGLASYKLIGHYFHKKSAYLACKKAFMTTRVGDIGMFLALLAIYMYTGTLQFYGEDGIFARLDMIPQASYLWIALGLFMGAAGKSAQFPLHIWLPDAMEGPTPVSALIHAATMVAAGVYLVGRMYTLIVMAPAALAVISIVGCFTAVFAASIAFTATDIKKVLAYSTVSQLGFMFTALGVGSNIAWQAGLFHLCTHAFFKGCLFLCSGSVIHACHHEQEMTRMGGLWKKMPITGTAYLISCLSIAGFPFITAGFYSKDQILQSLWAGNGIYDDLYKVIFVVLAITAGMTAFYMFRSFFLTFMTKPRDHHVHDHAHESPKTMTTALIVLATLAVVVMPWWPNMFLANGTEQGVARFARAFAVEGADKDHVDHAHHAAVIASLIVGLSGIGLCAGAYLTERGARMRIAARNAIGPVYKWAYDKFYVDELVEYLLIQPSIFLGALMAWFDSSVLDQGVVDGVGRTSMKTADVSGVADDRVVDGAVQGAAGLAWLGGGLLSRFQSGRVRNYLFGAVGTAALFAFVVLYVTRS